MYSHELSRGEYEKLFNTLEKSNRNEKRLKTKCKALQSEISQHVSQVDLAHEQSKVYRDYVCLGIYISSFFIKNNFKTSSSVRSWSLNGNKFLFAAQVHETMNFYAFFTKFKTFSQKEKNL